MKKDNSGLGMLRHAHSCQENKKQDHFLYFESLQQRLLQQSEKLTNLIGFKSFSSIETNSVNQSPTLRNKYQQQNQLPNSHKFNQNSSRNMNGYQSYSVKVKNLLASSKSQFSLNSKDKTSQLQRKLTYNLVKQKYQEPQVNSNSPSKSQKLIDRLKKTSSTTSSSAIVTRTIDKIKRMSSLKEKPTRLEQEEITKKIKIQDFQILKYLQQGQFGVVYLSRHKATNFLCAIKKIPKIIFQGNQKFISQLAREVKIQGYLDHPNIVQLYTCFCDLDNFYLVLQLCCGGNVYGSLKSLGRFTQQKVRTIIRQVSHAIQFMHDSDIIHRDIKPQNILIHQDIAKVCDFGWSIHSPLLRDTRCGTPLYSSPQVIQKQQYDNKIDVWNIGILTYQLLYGRVPFQIRTQQDLVKVVDEEIYFSKNIPITSEAKDFILKCLIKNPKDRLPMAKLTDHLFLQCHNN